jgi:hypothetical protein
MSVPRSSTSSGRTSRTSYYRVPTYRARFSATDLAEVKHLNKNVASISLEFHLNEKRAARRGCIYTVPPEVIDTRHAAACALKSWLLILSKCFGDVRLSNFVAKLEEIRNTSLEVPIISDPLFGEDDAPEHIRSWVELTGIYRSCIQEARCSEDLGGLLRENLEPYFVVYPPAILLAVEYTDNN